MTAKIIQFLTNSLINQLINQLTYDMSGSKFIGILKLVFFKMN